MMMVMMIIVIMIMTTMLMIIIGRELALLLHKQAGLVWLLLVIQLNGSLAVDCLAERLIFYNPKVCMCVRLIQNIQKLRCKMQLYMPALQEHNASCDCARAQHGFLLCFQSKQHASRMTVKARFYSFYKKQMFTKSLFWSLSRQLRLLCRSAASNRNWML